MAYLRTAQTNKSVTCICVPNCLYFVLRTGLAGGSVQSYEKGSFLVLLAVLVLFPKFLVRLRSVLYHKCMK